MDPPGGDRPGGQAARGHPQGARAGAVAVPPAAVAAPGREPAAREAPRRAAGGRGEGARPGERGHEAGDGDQARPPGAADPDPEHAVRGAAEQSSRRSAARLRSRSRQRLAEAPVSPAAHVGSCRSRVIPHGRAGHRRCSAPGPRTRVPRRRAMETETAGWKWVLQSVVEGAGGAPPVRARTPHPVADRLKTAICVGGPAVSSTGPPA